MPVTRVDLSSLTGPHGDIARDLAKRAIRVESRAKQLCPVDTGRLRASITWELVRSSGGVFVARIGTNVDYAMVVHEGRRAVEMPPGRVMRFPSRKTGQIVYTRRTRAVAGVPFLRNALPAAA